MIAGDLLGTEAENAYLALRTWIFGKALPFWSTVGRDRPGLGFVEHLNLAGQPANVLYKRVRVQARQIFVFSHAHLLGYPGALEAAADSYTFLTQHAWRKDGSCVRVVGREGGVVDPTVDLYDLAFVLFALAWYARASGSVEAIDRAHLTLDWIKRTMGSPLGGFHNAIPIPTEPRQQNPHMHLLEAMLALFETTRDIQFLEIARPLVELFCHRFFDSETNSLGEFFRPDWSWMDGEAGTHVEPGHHYEWVWILSQYERLSNRTVTPEKDALYAFANRWGRMEETGLVVDVVDRNGALRDGSARIWPQTEAIKAHVVMAKRDTAKTAGAWIAQIVNNLLTQFFACEPVGTWIEHFTANGEAKGERIPSSSFYHIFAAFSALEQVFGNHREHRASKIDVACEKS